MFPQLIFVLNHFLFQLKVMSAQGPLSYDNHITEFSPGSTEGSESQSHHITLETSLICILLLVSRDVHFDKRMICLLSDLL